MPWQETGAMTERLRFIVAVQAGEASVAALCRQFGISRKTGYKWLSRYREAGGPSLTDRSRAPHRPGVCQIERRAVGELRDGITHGELARFDRRQLARHTGRDQDAVLQARALRDDAEHVAARDGGAPPQARGEGPALSRIERRGDCAGLDKVAGLLRQAPERPPDAVDDRAQQSGAQLGRERGTGRLDRLSAFETGGLLVHLKRRGVALDPNHFAEKAAAPDARQLVQRRIAHRGRLCQRSGDSHQSWLAHLSLTR